MIAKIVRVRKSKYDRCWVTLSCGHRMLCCDSMYWRGLNIECERCTQIEEMECGHEYEVKISWCPLPSLMKYMGAMPDGWLRFILSTGLHDVFQRSEIQSAKRIR